MRRTLDRLYTLSGAAAAMCLLAILVLVAVQIGARLLDSGLGWFGLPATGFIVPSLAEIAGFLLAAATFLALADTFAKSVHIRVNLVTARLPARPRCILEAVVALIGAMICAFAAFALGGYALGSFEHGDVSYGIVRVPLALPQMVMCLGLVVFTIALVDAAVAAMLGLRHVDPVNEREA